MQFSLRNRRANKPIACRPKKGTARETKLRGKLTSKIVEIIFLCAFVWQQNVVRAPPVNTNFEAIRRKRQSQAQREFRLKRIEQEVVFCEKNGKKNIIAK